jgi:hypothetical protein
MDMWACGPLGQYVDFICVCVDDDKNIAIHFEKLFKFKKAINGVVMCRPDMPTFGQLGCSGFIVIGANGLCASKKTSSFLDFGEKAFQNAEYVIQTALEDAGVELKRGGSTKGEQHLYAEGQKLRLESITSDPTLNGRIVTVIKFDTTKGRFNVLLGGDTTDRQISVMPCCLAPVAAEGIVYEEYQVPNEIQPPRAVGCQAIDEEHVQCTASFNECFRSATRENLAILFTRLEQHFVHEEAISFAGGFGSVNDTMSPMFSHAKDHARILGLVRAELERTLTDSSAVDLKVIETVAQSFLEHAKTFDSLLEEKLLKK